MLKLIVLLVMICSCFACRREPSPYHSRVSKISGDNGFKIKINENPEKYVPGRLYTGKCSNRNNSTCSKIIFYIAIAFFAVAFTTAISQITKVNCNIIIPFCEKVATT